VPRKVKPTGDGSGSAACGVRGGVEATPVFASRCGVSATGLAGQARVTPRVCVHVVERGMCVGLWEEGACCSYCRLL